MSAIYNKIMSPLEWLASPAGRQAARAGYLDKVSDTGPRDKGKPGGLTKPATSGSISDRYAEDPTAFGVIQDWKDGLDTRPMKYRNLPARPEFNPKTGEVYNSWFNKNVPPKALQIMPRPGWHRLMTNFNGTPIISGKESTYPKEPDHPFYHMVVLHSGSAGTPMPYKIDAMRTGVLRLLYGTTDLNKIPYNS